MDIGQRDKSINGEYFEREIYEKSSYLEQLDSRFNIYRGGGTKWKTLPKNIRDQLRIPRNNKPHDLINPDCDVIISYNRKVFFVLHCRRNLREVEKNLVWVHRMKQYKPTSHIRHLVITKDVDGDLCKKRINNKSRDMASHYDATYSTNEDIIFESPFVWPSGEHCNQIVRKFSRFTGDIIQWLSDDGVINDTIDIKSLDIPDNNGLNSFTFFNSSSLTE